MNEPNDGYYEGRMAFLDNKPFDNSESVGWAAGYIWGNIKETVLGKILLKLICILGTHDFKHKTRCG